MLIQRLKKLALPEPIAIIGGGVTGLSCFNLLQSAGIACRVFDERDSVPDAFVEYTDRVTLGVFSSETFSDFGTILLSPGVDTRRDCFARFEDKLLTDIELFARLVDKPVIGVTGSNGKSTVVTLLHQVTQQAGQNYLLCGNIGLSVLQALSDSNADTDGYIVELSSYQLERSPSLQLDIGVWLNVSPDHLDRYDSYDDYVKTKAEIFNKAQYLVANANDSRVLAFADLWVKEKRLFSIVDDSFDYYLEDNQIYHADQCCFSMVDFPQLGLHHTENVMAVFAVAELLGIDNEETAVACREFTPLPSRSVVIGEKNDVLFINDSKGTNVGATVAAISGIARPIILIAGGQGKGQDFHVLAKAAHHRVKAAVFIGEDALVLKKALHPITDCYLADDLAQAVKVAIEQATAGDVVMLSPACASFDMFDSYLQRGEIFETLVKEWINE